MSMSQEEILELMKAMEVLHDDLDIDKIIENDLEEDFKKYLENEDRLENIEIIEKINKKNSLKCLKVILNEYPQCSGKENAELIIKNYNLGLGNLDEIIEKNDIDRFKLLVKLEIIRRGNLKSKAIGMNF